MENTIKLKKQIARYDNKNNIFYCQVCDKFTASWMLKDKTMICNSCLNKQRENETIEATQ